MITFNIDIRPRYSMLFTCEECDYLYVKNSNSQKYCEKCRPFIKQDYSLKTSRTYRKRYGYSNKKELGTSNFGRHRNEDFTEEYSLIQKEMRRIGI